MHRYLALILAVSSGVLLALCYPRFNVEVLVWVWGAPLMVALWWLPGAVGGKGTFRRGFALGYVAGITFFGINLSWIHEVTLAGAIIFPLYLGLFFAVWGGLAATVGRPRDESLRGAPEPTGTERASLLGGSWHALRCAAFNAGAWVCLEWLRGWLLTGFGWNGLAVAFHDNLNLIQITEITGVVGLSFLPVFVGCILVTTVRRFLLEIRHGQLRPHLDFGLALALVAATFLFGLSKTLQEAPEALELDCVLVQLAVPQEEKWDPDHAVDILRGYEEYTTAYVEAGDPDLVLWPESALPTSLFEDPVNETYLNRLLAKGDFALMFGANDLDFAERRFYNGAALMKGEFISPHSQIYHKIHLVPFGEFVPFRRELPFLDRWLGELIPGDFDRGDSTEPLTFPGKPIKVTPLICFEDTVGRLARRFVRPEAQFMVNMTNDGWFGRTPAAEQHLANARFRCVELRRPMARACNTGVTCLIDERGRLTAVLEDPDEGVFVRGVLASTLRVPVNPPLTFYARYGDLFTALVAVATLATLIRRRAKHRRPGE